MQMDFQWGSTSRCIRSDGPRLLSDLSDGGKAVRKGKANRQLWMEALKDDADAFQHATEELQADENGSGVAYTAHNPL